VPRHATAGPRLAVSAHQAALAVTLLAALMALALLGAGQVINTYITAAAHQVQLFSEDLMPRQDPAPIYLQPDPSNKVAPISPRLLDEVHSS
jgi:hypothetical protein